MRAVEREKQAEDSSSWWGFASFIACVCVLFLTVFVQHLPHDPPLGVTYSMVILVNVAFWSKMGTMEKEKPLYCLVSVILLWWRGEQR